jgi:hypothetical protein
VGGFQSRYAQTCKSRLKAASRPATEGKWGDMFTIYPINPDSQGCKPFWSPGGFSPLPLKVRRRALASGLQAPCLSGLSPLAACHLLAAPPYVHWACPRPAASPEQLDNQTGRLELLPSAGQGEPHCPLPDTEATPPRPGPLDHSFVSDEYPNTFRSYAPNSINLVIS